MVFLASDVDAVEDEKPWCFFSGRDDVLMMICGEVAALLLRQLLVGVLGRCHGMEWSV